MNTTYLICGAILILVSILRTTEGWRDGKKWRERRIAHVFGKRNGDSVNKIFPFSLTQPAQLPSFRDSEESEEYDSSYDTEPDYIPDSVMKRLAYLDLLQRLRPSNAELLNYWDDIRNYLDYSEDH